jgi:ATP-dependent Clp protease ATP-binding subunit ClpB
LDHIGELGYDPVYGARPLKRAIQDILENPLSKALLSGQFGHGDTIGATYQNNEIEFKKLN